MFLVNKPDFFKNTRGIWTGKKIHLLTNHICFFIIPRTSYPCVSDFLNLNIHNFLFHWGINRLTKWTNSTNTMNHVLNSSVLSHAQTVNRMVKDAKMSSPIKCNDFQKTAALQNKLQCSFRHKTWVCQDWYGGKTQLACTKSGPQGAPLDTSEMNCDGDSDLGVFNKTTLLCLH